MIEVTEDSMYIFEVENKKTRMQGYLKDLEYVIIHDETEDAGGLTLCFTKKGFFYNE